DSSLMKSPEGRQKYAEAIVRGVTAYLGSQGGTPAR
ncbi:Rv3717 family N-acetylmuramoyl-L-alanine amidase, partial [Mycobacterium kansasii]